MRFGSSFPCSAGIVKIVALTIAASISITLVTGRYGHWVAVLLGIAVGLMAARSIRG